mgnify:CR=1 FL=1
MSVGIFVDKMHRPTMEEVSAVIGPKRQLWDSLTRFVVKTYQIQRDFAFYGKNYGWAVRFRAGGKALLSMYPGKESFTVQIVLGQTVAEQAFSLNLGKDVRKVLEKAHRFPEGRWLFIKVESQRDLNDIQRLLLVKSGPSKKMRASEKAA